MLRLSASLCAIALTALAVQPAVVIDQPLLAAATAEQPATIRTLERLVNIETGTGDAVGLAEMAALLESELKALGFIVERRAAVGDGEGVTIVGDNVVGPRSRGGSISRHR